MSSAKEIIVEIGPWAAFFLTVTGLWWRLTAKFARKDLVKEQFKSLAATVGDTKAEVSKLWDVLTDVSSDTSEMKGLLKSICNNHTKKEGTDDG